MRRMGIKTIIVDDEIDAIKSIELIVKEGFPELEIIAWANDIIKAKELIKKEKPDLVFLDIEMAKGNGFDLMEDFPEREFEVVFITAYHEYRLIAEAYNVPYYITKPVEIDELREIVHEVQRKRG